MELEQQDGVSTIKMDTPLTKQVAGELSNLLSFIGGQEPHKIILDFQLVPYVNTSGMNELFQQFSPLYNRKFNLEIQQVNKEVGELLRLANFHLISDISEK